MAKTPGMSALMKWVRAYSMDMSLSYHQKFDAWLFLLELSLCDLSLWQRLLIWNVYALCEIVQRRLVPGGVSRIARLQARQHFCVWFQASVGLWIQILSACPTLRGLARSRRGVCGQEPGFMCALTFFSYLPVTTTPPHRKFPQNIRGALSSCYLIVAIEITQYMSGRLWFMLEFQRHRDVGESVRHGHG